MLLEEVAEAKREFEARRDEAREQSTHMMKDMQDKHNRMQEQAEAKLAAISATFQPTFS